MSISKWFHSVIKRAFGEEKFVEEFFQIKIYIKCLQKKMNDPIGRVSRNPILLDCGNIYLLGVSEYLPSHNARKQATVFQNELQTCQSALPIGKVM